MTAIIGFLTGGGVKLYAILAAAGSAVVLAMGALASARRSGRDEEHLHALLTKERANAQARQATDDVAALDDRAVVGKLHSEYDTHQ